MLKFQITINKFQTWPKTGGLIFILQTIFQNLYFFVKNFLDLTTVNFIVVTQIILLFIKYYNQTISISYKIKTLHPLLRF